MICWKGETYWVGKLLDHPEIMTQGETIEELEENMKDVFRLMTMDDVPEQTELIERNRHFAKKIVFSTQRRKV